MAIVMGFGVPGFQTLVNGNRLSAAANEAVANLQTARMEAIRRGCRVVVCASGNANAGTGATCDNKDIDGWITFVDTDRDNRSEEHTSELQSLMRTSYAVFCLKKKQQK